MKAEQRTEEVLQGLKLCVSSMRTAVRMPGRPETVRVAQAEAEKLVEACRLLEIDGLTIDTQDAGLGQTVIRIERPTAKAQHGEALKTG